MVENGTNEEAGSKPVPEQKQNKFLETAQGVLGFIVINGLVQLFAYLGDGSEDPFIGGTSTLSVLQTAGVFAVSVQLIVFIPSFIFQTERFYDLTGSATCIFLSLYTLFAGAKANSQNFSDRAVLVTVLVLVWCVRLGFFLFSRIMSDGKDGRFDEIKPNFLRFLNVWTLQGLWVFLTAFPAYIVNSDQEFEGSKLIALDYIGLAIWILGFGIESIADYQKRVWRGLKEKKNPFIDYGLWNYSRHPNYFGEITLWFGVFLIAVTTFDGRQYSGCISPIFVFLLLNFVSGVPLLEKRSDEKFGKLESYQIYKKNTSILIPLPKSIAAKLSA